MLLAVVIFIIRSLYDGQSGEQSDSSLVEDKFLVAPFDMKTYCALVKAFCSAEGLLHIF